MTPPPERIALPAREPGTELRRWVTDDAELVFRAVTESFDHLHPWAAWAARPPTFEDARAYVTQAAREWNEGRAYAYGIFGPDGTLRGSAALMAPADGSEGALEIGYWTHVAHLRRGLATLAAGALTGAAFGLPGISLVRIRCDEANVASAAVPRRLGYSLDGSETREITAPAECGRTLRWIMTKDAYAG